MIGGARDRDPPEAAKTGVSTRQASISVDPNRIASSSRSQDISRNTIMAEEPSLSQQATQLALDVANGRHPLSKFVPPALLLADAALSAGVIWKIPCTSPRSPRSAHTN